MAREALGLLRLLQFGEEPHKFGASDPEVAAGGAVFFCYGVAHSTGDNGTDHDRAGIAFHFLHRDCANDDLVAPDRDRRPWITGLEATGGQREYGVDVSGDSFADLVQRLLDSA